MLRDYVDYDYVDETMLRTGALGRNKILVILHGGVMEKQRRESDRGVGQERRPRDRDGRAEVRERRRQHPSRRRCYSATPLRAAHSARARSCVSRMRRNSRTELGKGHA